MWLTENPWPPIFLCGVGAVICGILWYQRQQTRYLAGVLGLVVLSVAVWAVERAIVTDRERVEEAVLGITSAFQQQDLDRTLSYVSAQAPEIQMLVMYGIDRVQVGDDMRITDIQVDLSGQNTRARSRFRVNATITERRANYSQRHPSRWETKWQLEGEDWRLFEIVELDPLTGEEIDRLSRYRPRIPNFAG